MDKKCPSGYIMRKGYTRKFRNTVKREGYTVHRRGKIFTVKPKKNEIRVDPSCIINRGLPGKGPKEGEGIGKLRKGELIKYGYSYRLPNSIRHKSLKKAIEEYGPLSVYRKLNAVAKYTSRTSHGASTVFSKNRNWIRSNYTLKKNNSK
jgi:hypothetical protein